MRRLILFPFLFILQFTYAQSTLELKYAQYWGSMMHNENNGCGGASTCPFGPTAKQFLGANHTATRGCVGVGPGGSSGSGVLMFARNMQSNGNPWRRGQGFFIDYPFLQGYSYRITTKMLVTGPNGYEVDAGADPSARSYLQVQLTNTPQQYNGSFCTVSAEPVDISNTTNPYGYFYDTDPVIVFKTRSIILYADQCYSHILFNTYPDDTKSCAGGFEIADIIIEPVLPSFSISGLDGICVGVPSANYTIDNLPANSTVCWSIDNPGAASIPNPSCGNSVTVSQHYDGNITLRAAVTSCGGVFTVTKPISIGDAFPLGVTWASSNSNTYNGPLLSSYSFFLHSGESGIVQFNITDTRYSNITWTPVSIPPSGSSWSTHGPNNQQLNLSITAQGPAYSSNTIIVRMNATGPCGPMSMDFAATAVVKGWSFKASPNPASSNLQVQVEETSADVKKNEPVSIMLYPIGSPTLSKKWEFKNNQRHFNLNVAGIRKGQYLLVIRKGNEQKTQQIMIE
jgi:hypothetical protein